MLYRFIFSGTALSFRLNPYTNFSKIGSFPSCEKFERIGIVRSRPSQTPYAFCQDRVARLSHSKGFGFPSVKWAFRDCNTSPHTQKSFFSLHPGPEILPVDPFDRNHTRKAPHNNIIRCRL